MKFLVLKTAYTLLHGGTVVGVCVSFVMKRVYLMVNIAKLHPVLGGLKKENGSRSHD